MWVHEAPVRRYAKATEEFSRVNLGSESPLSSKSKRLV